MKFITATFVLSAVLTASLSNAQSSINDSEAAFWREIAVLAERHSSAVSDIDKRIEQLNFAGMISLDTLTVPTARTTALNNAAKFRILLAERRELARAIDEEARQLIMTKLWGPSRQPRIEQFESKQAASLRNNEELDAVQLSLLTVIEETLRWTSIQDGFGAREGKLIYGNSGQQAEFGIFRRRLEEQLASLNQVSARSRALVERLEHEHRVFGTAEAVRQ